MKCGKGGNLEEEHNYTAESHASVSTAFLQKETIYAIIQEDRVQGRKFSSRGQLKEESTEKQSLVK